MTFVKDIATLRMGPGDAALDGWKASTKSTDWNATNQNSGRYKEVAENSQQQKPHKVDVMDVQV